MHRGEEVWGNVMDNGHEDTSRIVVRTPLKSVGKKMAAVNGIRDSPIPSFSLFPLQVPTRACFQP